MEDRLTQAELLDILRNRSFGYAFLSMVYRAEVSSALLSQLVNDAVWTVQEDVTSEGHGLLREFVRRLKGEDLKTVETQLAVEYASLFLGVGRNPVFPYESVYTSEEKLLMQKARDEVLQEYRAEGLDITKEVNEPEDHIAIELEFMSYLCQKTIEAMENDDKERSLAYLQKQRDFLAKHLMVWVPDFCADLAQAAESDFYKGIAKVTKDHLSLEQETIGELIEAIQGDDCLI